MNYQGTTVLVVSRSTVLVIVSFALQAYCKFNPIQIVIFYSVYFRKTCLSKPSKNERVQMLQTADVYEFIGVLDWFSIFVFSIFCIDAIQSAQTKELED
jgi:hypothetical protein